MNPLDYASMAARASRLYGQEDYGQDDDGPKRATDRISQRLEQRRMDLRDRRNMRRSQSLMGRPNELAPPPAAPPASQTPAMPDRPDMPEQGILMKGVGGLQNLLDLPASMGRDVLTFNNPFDQLLTPFSDVNRARGTDIRKVAYAGDGETTAGKVGLFATDLGIEILLDPLTYMTFGATAALKAAGTAGKAARAANKVGLLDDAAKAASKKLNRKVGKREALQNLTVNELLDFSRQKNPLRATSTRTAKREEFSRSLDHELRKLSKEKAAQVKKDIGSTSWPKVQSTSSCQETLSTLPLVENAQQEVLT